MTDNRSMFIPPVYPFERARDGSGRQKPQKAIVREVDFRLKPYGAQTGLEIHYSRYTKIINVRTDAVFKQLLKDVYNYRDQDYTGGTTSPKQKRPFNSQISMNNNELIYLIFRLRADKKWQFAREGWPITIGEVGRGYFFDAYRVDANGNADNGDDKKLIRDGCMVAYVVSDAKEALVKNDIYCHPINLHIDLINEVDVEGELPPKPLCYLPIIVDPDVRYPGGSD